MALVLRPVQDPPWLWMIGAGLAVIGLAWAFVHYVELMTSEFAVTSSRLILKVGLISRYTTELLLTKVETIGVQQGLMGRMLGYGDLTVTGTGGAPGSASAATCSRPRSGLLRDRARGRARAERAAAYLAPGGAPSSRATLMSWLWSRRIVGLITMVSITVRGGRVAQSRMARATSSACIMVERASASGRSGRLSRIGVSTSAGMMVVARMPLSRSTLWTWPMRLSTAALAAP